MEETLEDIAARTVITFPAALPYQEMDRLFLFISQEIGGSVICRIGLRRTIEMRTKGVEQTPVIKDDVYNLQGTVEAPLRSGDFCCSMSATGDKKFTALQFFSIPGYSLQKHHKSFVRLWDDVRKAVDEYFQLREMRAL